MALKKGLTDPLNWLLLLLAAAFAYYIFAVPYFTDLYLKTPQEMTMADYLASPAHPRAFMLHALSVPPSSIEIVITDLTVVHVDQDSILVEDRSLVRTEPADAAPVSDETEPTEGETPAQATDNTAPALLELQPEAPPPANQILIAGENVDLLGIAEGQVMTLRTHALHESPLGWVPKEPDINREDEQFFSKDELDELQFMKFVVGGEEIRIPYVQVGELRFANGSYPAGEPFTLDQLANDTAYIQAANRLAGGTIDLYNVRISDHTKENRAPLFIVEDPEGRRAKVYYNPRLLSEWYWAMDRIGDLDVVIRGTLRREAPGDLRRLEAEGNFQAILDGYEILASDGKIVISLENPAGGLGFRPQ